MVLIYEGEKIGMSSLHSYMYEAGGDNRIFLDECAVWVLNKFKENEGISLGRTRIFEIARLEKKYIGEGKIRRIITELKNMHLIDDTGSKGSKITELGKTTLDKYF
jgi:ribosomal protein S19E (S16A)